MLHSLSIFLSVCVSRSTCESIGSSSGNGSGNWSMTCSSTSCKSSNSASSHLQLTLRTDLKGSQQLRVPLLIYQYGNAGSIRVFTADRSWQIFLLLSLSASRSLDAFRLRLSRITYANDKWYYKRENRQTYLFFTGNSRYWIRILFCWTISTNKVYTANVTILCTNERVTAMTCSNPPLPSLILSNCAKKMEKLNWITIRISFPRLRVSGIVSASTVSTSFCLWRYIRLQTFGCFFTEICDLWSDHVQYVGKNECSIRYSNFKDYTSWKKPAI